MQNQTWNNAGANHILGPRTQMQRQIANSKKNGRDSVLNMGRHTATVLKPTDSKT